MISLVNVFVKYTKEFYALSNITFKADRGEIVALVGPKDSGKTCLLRLLTRLEKADRGEIYVKDIPIHKLDYKTDISMGYIPYKASFFDKKTVFDNLKYVLDIRKDDGKALEKINEAIINFRLEKIQDERIYKLSLFQKYLVSIARLSFRKLDVVLIDNIFEELTDEETVELIRLFKLNFVNKNTLVIFATSDEKIARMFATRLCFIEYGVITKDLKLAEEEQLKTQEKALQEKNKTQEKEQTQTNQKAIKKAEPKKITKTKTTTKASQTKKAKVTK